MKISSVIKLCRPKQWVKNVFVFLPLFFSGKITNIALLGYALVAFASFCLVSSAIYCLNDWRDVEADRQHPVKCKRPVASGEVSKGSAFCLTAVLFISSVALCGLLPYKIFLCTGGVIAAYFILNVAYCLRLKRIALVDVLVVSAGFVLRVAAGGTATGILVSHWIVLMTFLLALFLALAKRRDDILIFNSTGKKMRHNIDSYNIDFINSAMTIVCTVTLICYIMYTVSPDVEQRFGTNLVYLTSLFVLAGILRYLQLTVVFSKTGSPTKVLFRDRFVQLCVVGWIVTFAFIIYL